MIPGSFDPDQCTRLCVSRLQPAFKDLFSITGLDARHEFYLRMLGDQRLLQSGKCLVDLGPGLSMFGAACAAHGMSVTLVDDFGGGGGLEIEGEAKAARILEVLEKTLGLAIVREDFLKNPLPLADASTDVVTCFHSLEHWHNSPRPLFREIVRILKPGGFLVLATPNAVNIRKRAYVVLGRNNFPDLGEWYHHGDPVFRGHVREPTLADLQHLLEWNGFSVIASHGRNFIGAQSLALRNLPAPLVKGLASVSDRLLRLFPQLCSDIHVVGQLPLNGKQSTV
jgi:SAM-dependent methyltransferase